MDSREKDLCSTLDAINAVHGLNRVLHLQALSLENLLDNPSYHPTPSTNTLDLFLENIQRNYFLYFFQYHEGILSGEGKLLLQELFRYSQQHKIAQLFFNSGYYGYIKDLRATWEYSLKNNSIMELSPRLDQHRAFLLDIFQKNLSYNIETYPKLMSYLFGKNVTDSFLKQIETESHSFFHLYRTVKGQERKYVRTSHLSSLSQDEKYGIYQVIIEEFQKEFPDIEAIVLHLSKGYESKLIHIKPTHFHLFIPEKFRFIQGLHHLLKYLGMIDEYHQNQTEIYSESPFWQLDRTAQQCLKRFQYQALPHNPYFLEFLVQTILQEKGSRSRRIFLECLDEITASYLELHKNILSPTIVNPLQELCVFLAEVELESNWYNQTITSTELAQSWKNLAKDHLDSQVSHHMDGILRMSHWIERKIGKPFLKMMSLSWVLTQIPEIEQLTPDQSSIFSLYRTPLSSFKEDDEIFKKVLTHFKTIYQIQRIKRQF